MSEKGADKAGGISLLCGGYDHTSGGCCCVICSSLVVGEEWRSEHETLGSPTKSIHSAIWVTKV